MEPHSESLRPPSEVMRLARMGAMFPTRLSFLRVLMRDLAAEGTPPRRTVWDVDAEGFGHAVYQVRLGGRDYALVAVSTPLPDHLRSDRVIAQAWDSSFVLFDGVPGPEDITRILSTAPLQEAERFTQRDLVLSRANKSMRAFGHVVSRLRAGLQPDPALLHAVGYVMRTTAVYGNGKFGIADRHILQNRPGLGGAFAAEMLTVWLIRAFTIDLVEHLGGRPLNRALKRGLGVGNATGLGMAPFLVSHPVLLHRWMAARERALARVIAQPQITAAQHNRLQTLARRADRHLAGWSVADAEYTRRNAIVRAEWPQVQAALADPGPVHPLRRVLAQAAKLSLDTQELLIALLLEPFADLVDPLAAEMTDPGLIPPPASTDPGTLRRQIETQFGWALGIDFASRAQTRRFWYVSEEKREPRLGDRWDEPGAELESPLDIARRVQALYHALRDCSDLRALLLAAPEHALAVQRVALAQTHPYAEIRDNLIAETCRPIDMLRCKLAFFGATRFDPKSDLWTRVTLAAGAPLFDEITGPSVEDWWLPEPVSHVSVDKRSPELHG